MKLFLAFLFNLLNAQAAVLSGGILYSTDTTGTNARPSAVTITPSTGGTNLLAGTLTATNLLLVPAGGARINGFITNDSLAGDGLMFAPVSKRLTNLSPGEQGQLINSQGAGTTPAWSKVTITPSSGGTNLWAGTLNATNDITLNGISITNSLGIWTNDNGTISAPIIGDFPGAIIISTNGAISTIGSLDWWNGGPGGSPDGLLFVSNRTNQESDFIVSNISADGTKSTSWYLETASGADGASVELSYNNNGKNNFTIYSVSNHEGYFQAGGRDNTGTAAITMEGRGAELGVRIHDNTFEFLLDTGSPDDGSTAFKFPTIYKKTSGNMLAIVNSNVTEFAVSTVSGWTGAGTRFFADDGTFKTVGSSSGANPTATLGLSAINGTSTNFMRSDGAPALSQSIAPTWTGAHVFQPGSGTAIQINPASSAAALAITNDVFLYRESANFLGQRNGSTAQNFAIYNTFTDASNYERILMRYAANKAQIFANNSGSGSARILLVGGEGGCELYSSGASRWFVNTSGNLVAMTDGLTIGLGASVDVVMGRDAAATLQLGVDAATATAQKLKAADGSGTDKAGFNLTLAGGQGTGTGRGGDFIVQTAPSSTTGSSANSYTERAHYSAKAVALTETTATIIANIPIASSKFIGAKFICTVNASDGTDFQAITSEVAFSAVNKAGVIPAITVTQVDSIVNASSGTLTPIVYTAVVNGAGVDLKCTATSSLSQTTLNCSWVMVAMNSDGAITVTPQ